MAIRSSWGLPDYSSPRNAYLSVLFFLVFFFFYPMATNCVFFFKKPFVRCLNDNNELACRTEHKPSIVTFLTVSLIPFSFTSSCLLSPSQFSHSIDLPYIPMFYQERFVGCLAGRQAQRQPILWFIFGISAAKTRWAAAPLLLLFFEERTPLGRRRRCRRSSLPLNRTFDCPYCRVSSCSAYLHSDGNARPAPFFNDVVNDGRSRQGERWSPQGWSTKTKTKPIP